MTQQPIIDPVDAALLKTELTPERFLRHTNKGGNEIYVVDGREAPAVMREVGRLREISFRKAGGGSGKDCDIDEFDLMDPPCRQLILWNPDKEEIIGGYRFILGEDVKFNADGTPRIATSHLFRFSDEFMRQYMPHTMELGRSFVRPEYQSSQAGAKAIFALDNLWDGLGALTVVYPQVKYLFGKFTMYPTYNRECRNLLLYFLIRHFPDPDRLVEPINPMPIDFVVEKYDAMFTTGSFKDDYRVLNGAIRQYGINIPPLVNAYMNLSPTMRMFGTAVNDTFGNVEESGILLTIDDIFEEKKQRHIATYKP